MPYKYIGRTTDFRGKTLWEIVGNLKNFGVGRMVYRNMWKRYPEPSYLRILKVEPIPAPEKETLDNFRKVRVVVERTFRGITYPQPVYMMGATYKTDYRLLLKDEEEAYCGVKVEPQAKKVYPKYMEFPPLLKHLLMKENTTDDPAEEPKLEIVYNKVNYGKYRVAADGERPDFEFEMGLGSNPSNVLYENIHTFKLSTQM